MKQKENNNESKTGKPYYLHNKRYNYNLYVHNFSKPLLHSATKLKLWFPNFTSSTVKFTSSKSFAATISFRMDIKST